MTDYVCSIDGCGRDHKAVGLCAFHYARRRRSTLADLSPSRIRENAAKRSEELRARAEARLVARREKDARIAARQAAYMEKQAEAEEHNQRRIDRRFAERLEALYEHPATARVARLLATHRFRHVEHVDELINAARGIPDELRRFASNLAMDIDPLWPIAQAIAKSGGATSQVCADLYGMTKQRIDQIEKIALGKLILLPEAQEMRLHLERDASCDVGRNVHAEEW